THEVTSEGQPVREASSSGRLGRQVGLLKSVRQTEACNDPARHADRRDREHAWPEIGINPDKQTTGQNFQSVSRTRKKEGKIEPPPVQESRHAVPPEGQAERAGQNAEECRQSDVSLV